MGGTGWVGGAAASVMGDFGTIGLRGYNPIYIFQRLSPIVHMGLTIEQACRGLH